MANKIPQPTFEYDAKKLSKQYSKALKEVQGELNSLMLTDMQRANIIAAEANIKSILSDIKKYGDDWSTVSMTKAGQEGVASTIYSLGLANSMEDALKIASFNQVNRRLVAAAIADTQADLLAVTQNIDRQSRLAIRRATAEAVRGQLAQGINGTRSLSSAIRNQITQATDVAIIDARGNRWKVGTYADMLARTKMMAAHRESSINEALSEGAYYGIISRHGATDACAQWESKIVKLVADAPGDYTYIGDIPRNQLFHPACKHTVSPTRDPNRTSAEVKRVNGITETPTESSASQPNNAGEYVEGAAIDVVGSRALRQMVENPSAARRLGEGGEDMVLKTLAQEQGFVGKAQIISSTEIDEYIAKGEIELFRGVTKNSFANDLRDGDYFAGLGAHGNGIYTAYGKGIGDVGLRDASGLRVAVDYAGDTGSIVRMTLRADAKVIKNDQLLGEMMDFEDDIAERLAKAKTKTEIAKLEAEKTLMQDKGRFATAKGYDAINVGGEQYMVVLNRSALRMQDVNFDLKEASDVYNFKP